MSNDLINLGISIALVSVEKNRPNHIEELNKALFERDDFSTIKVILYVDHVLDLGEVQDVVWRFTNNLDPKRDGCFVKSKDLNSISHVGFDGTRKTKELDNFQRDWPNVVCSDEATIKAIDEKWDKLGLGELIESPSIKHSKQLYGTGAIAN